jgi:hypothetical protein
MKQKRSAEMIRVRRDLAQLLRNVRAIRRARLSERETIDRLGAALTSASRVRRFVKLTAVHDEAAARCNWQLRVDRRLLDEAQSRGDGAYDEGIARISA